jgi:hypothetical protein
MSACLTATFSPCRPGSSPTRMLTFDNSPTKLLQEKYPSRLRPNGSIRSSNDLDDARVLRVLWLPCRRPRIRTIRSFCSRMFERFSSNGEGRAVYGWRACRGANVPVSDRDTLEDVSQSAPSQSARDCKSLILKWRDVRFVERPRLESEAGESH